jgi:hypothetical protein
MKCYDLLMMIAGVLLVGRQEARECNKPWRAHMKRKSAESAEESAKPAEEAAAESAGEDKASGAKSTAEFVAAMSAADKPSHHTAGGSRRR